MLGSHDNHDVLTEGADAAAAVAAVRHCGVGVLRSVFSPAEINQARRTVLAHTGMMRNTRPTPSARHLAGFHRFPSLEPLHQLITGNQRVQDALAGLLGPEYRTIGLSDITVNRSQHWHKDLLRGQFSHYLTENPCENHHSKMFKVIVYLQDSTSLQFVPGSHRQDISLESDQFAIPTEDVPVDRVDAQMGDAVIIDICTTHRGSAEEAFVSQQVVDHPRILVSTVFGGSHCEFTERMERGNADRLAAWDHLTSS